MRVFSVDDRDECIFGIGELARLHLAACTDEQCAWPQMCVSRICWYSTIRTATLFDMIKYWCIRLCVFFSVHLLCEHFVLVATGNSCCFSQTLRFAAECIRRTAQRNVENIPSRSYLAHNIFIIDCQMSILLNFCPATDIRLSQIDGEKRHYKTDCRTSDATSKRLAFFHGIMLASTKISCAVQHYDEFDENILSTNA